MNLERLRLEIKSIIEISEKRRVDFLPEETLKNIQKLIEAAKDSSFKVIETMKRTNFPIAQGYAALKLNEVEKAYKELMGMKNANISMAIGDLISILIEMEEGRIPVSEIYVFDSKAIQKTNQEHLNDFTPFDDSLLLKVVNSEDFIHGFEATKFIKECECGNKITSINVRKNQEAIDIEEMAFCLEFECQVCGKTYKLNIEEIDEDDID